MVCATHVQEAEKLKAFSILDPDDSGDITFEEFKVPSPLPHAMRWGVFPIILGAKSSVPGGVH